MIGNDVVDLRLAAVQSNWRRKGFLDKVFSTKELDLLIPIEDHQLGVWLFWSMKEAAYKAHHRRFSLPRMLDWKRQKCSFTELTDGLAKGKVIIDNITYHTSSEYSVESIHTTASFDPGFPIKKALFQLPLKIVKSHLLKEICGLRGLSLNTLSLEKDELGIPYIAVKDTEWPLPFSLSGHGKYSGFCLPLTIS